MMESGDDEMIDDAAADKLIMETEAKVSGGNNGGKLIVNQMPEQNENKK